MCQLLGMNCATPTDFNFSFKGFAKRGGETDKHEHGWGLAIYEGRGLRTFHDSLPASVSKVADFVATYPIKTLNMMAHIRYATQGDVSLENVHPFQREMWGIHWSFAHNGDVPKYTKRIGNFPLLGRTNKANIFYHPVGDTDSEAVFCAILNGLRAEFTELPTLPVLYETIQRFCHDIIHGEEESTILNFLLGCGQYTLFAYSWPGARPGSKVWNGLCYTIRRPPFSTAKLADVDYAVNFENVTTQSDRVAVIATSPLTVNEEWNEFKRGQLLMFDNGWGYSELHDCQEVEQLGRGLCSEVMPKCQKEGYDTPALLRSLVDEVIDETKRRCTWAKRGADLGCGSGCAGVVFRSCIEHLTGVDISPEMVDKARQRGCYDLLLVGDIECVVGNGKDVEDSLFDIIFACNVFTFIHDIRGVFQSVSNSMKRKDGIFAFSAEFIEGGEEVPDVVLQSCARYAHKRSFIEAIAREFGFEFNMIKESQLREHEGNHVKGVLVVMSLL
mmetsp:Transcript_3328/g.4964  ORF Transcript_3328/g.4964 Transcript_3328/m.4964 type:complete len:501 (+) Transcript_3328:101-1603(+)|eukprot:CAMPEP_0194240166 /NCGR_PEP_ID=MMETSP0158-20130606/6413_1 /TAXON_ID=33649 /ORGANISM="Thalassionema nitzschioides, Strain L26-B" /LENGTH=500 /DNA_ID=CAMNT_0038974809 /DNA_START=15 /DNA_END=1517 /DNA_ORIENTATION=+